MDTKETMAEIYIHLIYICRVGRMLPTHIMWLVLGNKRELFIGSRALESSDLGCLTYAANSKAPDHRPVLTEASKHPTVCLAPHNIYTVYTAPRITKVSLSSFLAAR